MLKKILSFILLGSILSAFNPVYAAPAHPIKRIVFLGDSLSDNGNLWTGNTGPWAILPKGIMPMPPYFEGRFSDNEVWSDILPKLVMKNGIDHTVNYAVGGLVVKRHWDFSHLPYTLENSIDRYFDKDPLSSDLSDTLFIIWAGANDYLSGLGDQGYVYLRPEDKSRKIQEMTDDVMLTFHDDFNRLASRGAKHFLILNLPDLSRTLYQNEPAKKEDLFRLTLTHNLKLKNFVKDQSMDVSHKEVDIMLFDVSTILDNALRDPDSFNKKYGTRLKYFDKPCWQGGYRGEFLNAITNEDIIRRELTSKTPDSTELAEIIDSSPSLSEVYNVSRNYAMGDEKLCRDPAEYIFFDKVHPTSAVHSLIAKMVYEAMDGRWIETEKK